MRVCADPHNLPFANQAGEGYENRIAQALARDLGKTTVEFTLFPQRMGFVRNTLRKKDEATRQFACDVIIGVPEGYELTATTKPYMRSTYALRLRSARRIRKRLETADDLLKLPPEQLHSLRIGVFAGSPGADWLLRNRAARSRRLLPAAERRPGRKAPLRSSGTTGRRQHRHRDRMGADCGFPRPPALLVLALARGAVYPRSQIKFDYEISMGVRFGEKEWKDTLDQWIAGHNEKIHAILREYGVPLLDE